MLANRKENAYVDVASWDVPGWDARSADAAHLARHRLRVGGTRRPPNAYAHEDRDFDDPG